MGNVHINLRKSVLANYHHGDLRAALLDAARRMLEAAPAAELSLRALATAVGVSPNAPYRHFPTKEDLLAALAGQGFHELTNSFHPHELQSGPARLEGDLAAYLAFAQVNPGLYRLMFGRNLDPLSCNPQLGEHARSCFQALEATVAAVMGLEASDPAVAAGAASVWSLSHGAALLEIDRATAFLPPPARPNAVAMAQMVVAGLGRAKAGHAV